MTAGWAVILAGGDGTRLRALTRRISGDDRPKQFCPVLGGDTLLDQTRHRAARLVDPDRTLFLLTRTHAPYYASLRETTPARSLVVQPENRGTAPAILLAMQRLLALGAREPVVLLPSDHHVSDDAAFMAHVADAFDILAARPDLVVLLGVEATRPEVEYGWIEPGLPVVGAFPGGLRHVQRFVEKPAPEVAAQLLGRGALWNSFVIVSRPRTLLALFAETLPALVDLLDGGPEMAAKGPVEIDAERDSERRLERLYAGLPAIDFSKMVLSPRPDALTVLPVKGVDWNDLGHPARVDAVRACAAR